MDPDKWQRAKELFGSALARAPAERSSFLAQACDGDETLRQEVESLLAAHQDAATTMGGTGLSESAGAQAAPAPEDLVSGRRIGPYQIVRRIGRGGMASVYLAVRADDQYKKLVAIKLILPGLGTEDLLRRFRNERQTLAALDHPNIVKLLDGGTTEDSLPYLVMDYVEGTLLDEYCDHHKLSIDERLQLFRTVCAAVSYAHQRLIIHRDLKPGNILVTADGTPKLLDFGIAKLLNPEAAATLVVTRTGQRAMTPEYASPEQVRGEPLTNATDVYSLGVVLYELLTGHRLYRLKTHAMGEVEQAICEQEPMKPSTVVTQAELEILPDGTTATTTPEESSRVRGADPKKLRKRLHGDLDAIVMMALRKEPQRRYASVYELSEDIRRHLQDESVKARPATINYRTQKLLRRHKEAAAALSVAALLFAVMLAWQARRRNPAPAPGSSTPLVETAHVKPRRSVAVLGFKNLSGRPDAAWLSTALSEMLTTELAAGGKLRTLPGENVAQMKINLLLPDADSFGGETLAKIRKNLGSDDVVLGAYLALGNGQVRLDLKLQDAASGEVVDSVTQSGREQDVADLVSRCGASLRAKLGAGEVTEAEAATVKASLPSNPEAAKLYSEGLKKLRTWEDLAARDFLQKVITIEPNFALGHSALAAAWADLGYDAKGKTEAKKAFELSASLSHEDRLWVEGRYRETANEWDKAADIYRALFSSFPDNLEYGLRLALAQIAGGKGQDALSTVAMLRKLPAPARDDPRIEYREGQATSASGDYKRAQAAYARMAEKAEAAGSRLVLAAARFGQCSVSVGLGQYKEAKAFCEDAKRIYAEAGDRIESTDALFEIGWILWLEGDLVTARKIDEEALSVYREAGSKQRIWNAINSIGVVLQSEGDLSGSAKKYEEALAVAREIGNSEVIAGVRLNLGWVLSSEGHLAEARKLLENGLAHYRETSNKGVLGELLLDLATVLYAQGDLEGGTKLLDEDIPMLREIGDKSHLAGGLSTLGDILKAQDALAGARKAYEEALSIRKAIEEKANTAESMLSLAELSMEEGHPAQAEAYVQEALKEFRTGKHFDDEVWAYTVRALFLFASGKLAEAQKEIENMRPLVVKSQNGGLHLKSAIVAARIHAASGQRGEATRTLQATLSEATKSGFVGYQFEARLALGEIEMKAGQTAAGRDRLAQLEKDARAEGFLLIARKAASVRTGS